MLGHSAGFCEIHAVNLAQSPIMELKRVGYLACSLFFHESSELLIMLVSTLQRDLQSPNILDISVALNCLSKLLYKSIANALADPILKLLTHANEIIRKKTVMVMQRLH